MPTRVTGKPTIYAGTTRGVEAPQPPNITFHKRDPRTTDFFEFNTGDLWVNSQPNNTNPVTGTFRIWMLVAKNIHIATWVMISGGITNLETLTTDDGNVVGPDANANINDFSGGQGRAIPNTITAGNPATHTVFTDLRNVITLGDLAPANTLITGFGTTNDGLGPEIDFIKKRGAATVQNGDIIGEIQFSPFDGTNTLTANGSIAAVVQGAVAGGVVPTGLEFFTTATNAPLLRMVVNPPGGIVIHSPDTVGTSGIRVVQNNAGHSFLIEGMNNANSADPAQIMLEKVRLVAGVANTVQIGDVIGAYSFQAWDGATFQFNASIQSQVTGAVGAGVVPMDISFWTSNTNTGALTQRMLISSTGNVTINAPAAGAAINSISTFGFVCNGTGIPVLVDNAGQFGTVASSIKAKDNVKNMGDISSKIFDLRPVTFNYKKHSPDMKSFGLIAEEVAEVLPDLVVFKSGEPETVKYLDLIPMLLNEIQKLNKRIELIENFIADRI